MCHRLCSSSIALGAMARACPDPSISVSDLMVALEKARIRVVVRLLCVHILNVFASSLCIYFMCGHILNVLRLLCVHTSPVCIYLLCGHILNVFASSVCICLLCVHTSSVCIHRLCFTEAQERMGGSFAALSELVKREKISNRSTAQASMW